jgi:DNA-binding beta-propeller fold protein YncE
MGLNPEADVSGLALLPDGTLVGFDSQSALPSQIVQISKTTGVATAIGFTGETVLSSLGGLAVDPGTGDVYMSNAMSLFSVDPGTGVATEIGPHGEVITGLSFGPEPEPTCLLALDETSTLFDVAASDGSVSNLRPMGVDALGSLVRSPGGALYALRTSLTGELYTADVATGTATLVGPTGLTLREGGLDFDPLSGQLYGINAANAGLLFTLDTGTGAASTVGVVLDEFGAGIDASALAFDAAGTLYVMKSQPAAEIYRVNPTDASVFDRVPIPAFATGLGPVGMEFDDGTGTLYVSLDGQLVALDPGTGATVPIGPTPVTSGLEVVGPAARRCRRPSRRSARGLGSLWRVRSPPQRDERAARAIWSGWWDSKGRRGEARRISPVHCTAREQVASRRVG